MTTFFLSSAVHGTRWARRLLLAMSVAAGCANAAPPVAPITVATVPGATGDVQSIDALLRAFYEVVNGRPEVPRQWARDRTLYTPWVRFVANSSDADGRPLVHVRNHQQLVDESEPLVAHGFSEREIHRRVRVYAPIAHVDSTYETELAGPAGPQRSRGVKSMELHFDGQRWWITFPRSNSSASPWPVRPSLGNAQRAFPFPVQRFLS